MRQLLPGTLLEDLRTQKLRLFLTLFGIFWGTFAVVVLLAFGYGLERKANEEMAGGSGPVTLRNGWTQREYRGMPRDRQIRMRAGDGELLRREVPGITMLSEVSNSPRLLRAGKRTLRPSVIAVEPDYLRLQELTLVDGSRFINRRDIEERRRVAIIGQGV
ncbi:MAG: ABC transporter permease, partial [Longimicrobiales bacterium]